MMLGMLSPVRRKIIYNIMNIFAKIKMTIGINSVLLSNK